MKHVILIFLSAAFITSSCNSQDISRDKVPSVVQNTFKAKYAAATDVEWEKQADVYEADFDLNNTEISVRIDASGKVQMQKQDISVHELPAAVRTAIQNQYKDHTIDDADKIEKNGVVYYQVELEGKGNKDVKLVYTADGREEKSINYWD